MSTLFCTLWKKSGPPGQSRGSKWVSEVQNVYEIFLKAYSDKIIPEMQECNKLETAYQKLLASAQIEFEGETLTLSQLMPYKKTSDDAKRRAAWAAEAAFYSSVGDQLDDIYDQLVTLRTKMAKKIGYENFVPLGYLQMNRNCYSPKEIGAFRKAVVK